MARINELYEYYGCKMPSDNFVLLIQYCVDIRIQNHELLSMYFCYFIIRWALSGDGNRQSKRFGYLFEDMSIDQQVIKLMTSALSGHQSPQLYLLFHQMPKLSVQ